jgi:plastocyanin
MSSRALRLLRPAALAAAITAAACGGGSKPQPQPEAARPAPEPIDPATAGSVTGHITLMGTPPANEPIKTKSDPNCTKPLTTQTFVVGKAGALANVFVYVKDGLGNRVFAVPATPVVLAQTNCQYEPHVFGVQVGQTLDIVSNDPTLHNIHAIPEANQEFNFGQGGAGSHMQHVFSTKEVMVPFKCDVHHWMNAYVGIVDHPFFAVTGTDGAFSLSGLPPGKYTIEAVHEKLGRMTQDVEVGAKETKDVSFTFKI